MEKTEIHKALYEESKDFINFKTDMEGYTGNFKKGLYIELEDATDIINSLLNDKRSHEERLEAWKKKRDED